VRKLVTIVFVAALLAATAVSASAYDWSIGGNVGFDYQKQGDWSNTEFTISPEFARVVNEDVNVGVGVNFGIYKDGDKDATTSNSFGVFVFGERAVLDPGPFKLFIRADVRFDSVRCDYEGSLINREGVQGGGNSCKKPDEDRVNVLGIGILPNLQYALSDRLTLTVTSDFLRLGLEHAFIEDNGYTRFGFGVGTGSLFSAGLSYAF